jgi:hypothetical protein
MYQIGPEYCAANVLCEPQARRDVILSLSGMVKTSLVNFYQKTGFKPHRIIMYRKG